jgi:beta-lactamase regulating signal transducer with metallopeptidase domain
MLLFILESAARAAVLISLVWVLLRLLRVVNAHIELAVWTEVLIASLAIPVLMHLSPVTLPAPTAIVERFEPTSGAITVVKAETSPSSEAFASQTVPPAQIDSVSTPPKLPLSWLGLATGVYLVVAAFFVARLLLACLLVWRLWRRPHVVAAPEIPGMSLRVTDAVASPVTVGSGILLPPLFLNWAPQKRMAVLFHERGHAARGDFYVHLLAGLHCALFWFNPLAWWLRKRLVELSEITCDDAVVEKLGNRALYAEILLEMSHDVLGAPKRGMQLGVGMALRATVFGRIHRLLGQYRAAAPVSRRVRWAAAVAVLPALGLVTGTVAAAPPRILVLDDVRPQLTFQTLAVSRPLIPAAPNVPHFVEVSSRRAVADIPIPLAATRAVAADAGPSGSIAVAKASATAGAPQTVDPVCIKDMRKAEALLVIDKHTVLTKHTGEKFKRISVVNDPNDVSDPEKIQKPFILCIGDKVIPLGLESGTSFIVGIEEIEDAEAQDLRNARNLRVKSGPRNRLNFNSAGRIAGLCNDPRLSPLQIKACTQAMTASQSEETRAEIRERVRATIKRRQALANKMGPPDFPTNLTGPLNWGMNPLPPPAAYAPPPQ